MGWKIAAKCTVKWRLLNGKNQKNRLLIGHRLLLHASDSLGPDDSEDRALRIAGDDDPLTAWDFMRTV